MICPYRDSRQVQVLHERPIEIPEGQEVRQVTTTVFVPSECFEDQCAVWRDGQCMYNK